MPAPPLTELYDLLRAEGFAIGVDDHVRIGRLLSCDAAWTPELLHTAVAALVVTDPGERDAFDACWRRWMRGEPARPPAQGVRAADAVRLPPAVGAPPGERAGPRGLASRTAHGKRSPASEAEPSPPSADQPRVVGALRWRAMAAVAAAVVVAVAVVLTLWSVAGHRASGRGPDPELAESGSSPQTAGTGSGSGPQAAGTGSGSGPQAAGSASGSAGAGVQPGSTAIGSAGAGSQPAPSGSARDLAPLSMAAGAVVLASLAIAGLLRARGRRRFLPGPWRYELAVPAAVRPVLPRRAIEDAAADLTWRAPGAGRELDIARSIAATVERGGLPTLIHRRHAAAPRYLVLEDTAGGAGRWQPIYDELLSGLAREGVVIERYRFTASPERCVRPGGRAVSLDELADHADALIVIGDGDAAIDPLDGRRARWLAAVRQIPRRLWINPVPPARWSAGARTIAEHTPMEHGVARAVAALHLAGERRGRPVRPFPGVIERAPDTASAVEGLRLALGDPAFHLVSAVAVAAPPTLAAARWLAEVFALELDEQDWLAMATLPWFRAGAWPDGLRDRLSRALEAGAPRLAWSATAVADERLAASEPPHGSAAHLAWQLEGAARTARRGERVVAGRLPRRVVATPLADQPEVSRLTPSARSSVAAQCHVSVIVQPPVRRSAALWLVGALVAVIVTVAVSVADRMAVGAEERATASALTADAERIASVFDAAARAAQLRANSIATTPMLRQALETDTATLTDLATTEDVFTVGPGEALEVFRISNGKPVSLLRIPKSAQALPPPSNRDTRFRSDGLGVTLAASAPISGYREGLVGGIVVAAPVDLAAVRRSLDEHTAGASLIGLGIELILVDHHRGGAGGPPVERAIPSMGAWTAGTAKLIATPKRAPGLSWAGPARYAAGGLAVLLLIGFGRAFGAKPPLMEVPPPHEP